ncbi:MAG: hypothetical protein IAF00_04170 [Phycisphaerales bacterium]|nr:hypothetical protein [Phycisphaerales bacterium]
MKLIDLIIFFRRGGAFEDFCRDQLFDTESEAIEIYAQEPVNLESQLGFFPIEETGSRIEFQSGGILYHNFFDFFYFLDAIEDIRRSEGLTDVEIAQKLFSYAINDA